MAVPLQERGTKGGCFAEFILSLMLRFFAEPVLRNEVLRMTEGEELAMTGGVLSPLFSKLLFWGVGSPMLILFDHQKNLILYKAVAVFYFVVCLKILPNLILKLSKPGV